MSESVEVPSAGDLPTESADMAGEAPTEETHTPHPLADQGDDISPDKDGGVLKALKVKGDETEEDRPMPGDTVYVHYVGTLLSGTPFDSSRDRGEKFSFKLGQGNVIKAWDIGVATMRRGEISVLTCKPEYGYADRGQGSIPPNSTLVFEVELFDWKGEDISSDKDGSIMKRTLHAAEKDADSDTPNEDALVQIHLTCLYEGKEVDDRGLQFNIGEGSDHGVLEAVEIGIQKMKKGERAQLKLKPSAAYGSEGNKALDIPPDAPVTFNILLKEFTQAKDTWEMDIEEKITAAEACKEKGGTSYKSGNIQGAIKKWKRITFLLETETGLKEEEKVKSNALQLAANLNLALAYFKIQDYEETIKVCTTAIELDANSEKGFFRRGQAHFGKTDYEVARADFEKVVELSPENKAAKNQITLCNQKIKQQTEKEKKLYKNMFDTILRENREEEEQKQLEMAENAKNFEIQKEEGGGSPDSAEPMEAQEDTTETEGETKPDETQSEGVEAGDTKSEETKAGEETEAGAKELDGSSA